jgi:hypothetical protein
MPGEMSQMVAERPNAGAVGYHYRSAVVRRPRGRGFGSIVAHGINSHRRLYPALDISE